MKAPMRTVPHSIGVVAVAAFALLLVPLVAIVSEAPWSTLAEELTAPETLAAVRLSMIVSFGAVALSLLIGVPLAYALARGSFRGKGIVRTVVTVPLVLPPVVTGVALLSGFGRRSAIGELLGFGLSNSTLGATIAATIVAMPFLILAVEGALNSVDPELERVAAALGAPPLARWWRVSLPLARPGIVAGAVLAWARALGEFGATVTFAGNIPGVSRTLPLEIAISLESNQSRATAISLLMLVVSLVVLVSLRDRWLRR